MTVKRWSRDEMAAKVARDIPAGSYVNLGIGMPTLVGNHLSAEREVILHSENGLLGMGPPAAPGDEDPDLINASRVPVTPLPGVRAVEGFRDVPAVLRFENYRYRSAVYGIQPEGRLHRSLDRSLQPVSVPPGGVVLTDHLANEILHVRPGDVLTVEVLEGERRTVRRVLESAGLDRADARAGQETM